MSYQTKRSCWAQVVAVGEKDKDKQRPRKTTPLSLALRREILKHSKRLAHTSSACLLELKGHHLTVQSRQGVASRPAGQRVGLPVSFRAHSLTGLSALFRRSLFLEALCGIEIHIENQACSQPVSEVVNQLLLPVVVLNLEQVSVQGHRFTNC